MKTKYYILYKTTNLITGKYYVGMHTTSNLNDGYVGSGKILKRSIAKYGIENHSYEILQHCSSREELIELERDIVCEQLLNDPLSMNIRLGGEGGGGFTVEQQKENNRRSQEAQNWLRKNDPDWVAEFGKKKSDILIEAYKNGTRTSKTKPHNVGEYQHSDETKQKISEARKGQCSGRNNSQYGTCWINNGTINKKIKKDLFPKYATEGWYMGRIPKRK